MALIRHIILCLSVTKAECAVVGKVDTFESSPNFTADCDEFYEASWPLEEDNLAGFKHTDTAQECQVGAERERRSLEIYRFCSA